MIRFDYKEEKSLSISQEFAGDNIDVEISDMNDEVEYSFSVTQEDFIKLIDNYQKENNIL